MILTSTASSNDATVLIDRAQGEGENEEYKERSDNVSSVWFHFVKNISHPGAPHKHKTFLKKLGLFLESHPLQLFGSALTVLDLLCVCIDLFLLARKAASCDEENEGVERFEEVLRYISLSILGILAFEIFLLLIAFRLKFFKHPLYVLDMVVVGGSLVVEIDFNNAAGGLLVIARLWRVVRVVHGVLVNVEEKNEKHMKKILAELEHTKKELDNAQKENAKFRQADFRPSVSE